MTARPGRLRRTLLILLVALLVLLPSLARTYTEWLWFGEVGYRSVFWIPIVSGMVVAFVAALSVFVILWVNTRPLLRLRQIPRVIDLQPSGGRTYRQVIVRLRPATLLAAGAGIISLLAGQAAGGAWQTFQLWLHRVPFGIADPVFHRDVGFYVFILPAYTAVYDWLFSWIFIALLIVAAGYYLDLAPLMLRGVWAIPRGARVHLAVLAGVLLLLRAAGFWLDAYGLLFSPRGAVFGAGYTDLHATLPALRILMVLAAATGVLMLSSVWLPTLRVAVGSLAAMIVVWIVGTSVYPSFVQQFEVSPNELNREAPYIRNSIEATLHAFNLDQVQEQLFPATESLTPATVQANRSVLDNVRLWDYRPLLRTYAQLQGLRLYYTFTNVGVDRYHIGGREQQVMLSARELDLARLTPEARTWVNDHLVFTHGYGLVMTPVNRISGEGLPEFYIKDIPPQSPIGLRVARPELYYGLLADQYVIVKTRTKELDYPQGDQNVYASYDGTGGVSLSAPLAKLAFATRFGASQLMLTNDVTPESRVMFHREVRERVAHIAPMLTFDHDPYLVLADARLYWIVDAYTTSAGYPYAHPANGLNYIRNSVKVVVDAYNGTTRFYVVDPQDPLVEAYGRIFPGLFRPIAELPPSLAAHLRYPEDLFAIQAQLYSTFHMKDPRVFYNREDLWVFPNELFSGAAQPLEPYYVNLKLDPAQGEEFALILPFTPAGKDNMVAWMAGRSDMPHYGRLLVYRFPKDRTVFGPMQIEARINQDPVISSQLTLWNQQGSQVIRGNLLVVPVSDALLYIEPLYLQAAGSALPELKRVIVAYGARIAMEPTLEASLGRIFGTPVEGPPPPPGASAQPTGPAPPSGPQPAGGPGETRAAALVAEANADYARAQAALRSGDFAAYGREIDALGRVLAELKRETSAP
ncbi:MAG TPA: UPF0182 family protein [bacterium]|nr:UPF0182 family protein [bacterium]